MKTILLIFTFLCSTFAFSNPVLIKTNKIKKRSEFLKQNKKDLKKFTNNENSKYFKDLYYYYGNVVKLKREYPSVSIEEVVEFKAASIIPPKINKSDVNDPHHIMQWGRFFQDQIVTNEITDLKNIKIIGKKKFDIQLPKDLDQKFNREVIVAVVDTGVDFNHPDLKKNMATNDECVDGEIPYEPDPIPGDLYPGDCMGWDFTGKKEEGSNRPEDFVGHGTHIAGIISAIKDNEVGVSGISNKIKILPIKVLSNKNEDSQALGTSDRLSKAILYAIDRKADVINLSLGWPLSFDKEHLRQAIQAALDNGIIVVAAAGNNDHSEPIMPCAYDGVVCVGSTDPNGKISDFSNFGAHVDVLAPGNNIFSTYPTANNSIFTDFNGYEIKSGTSQSAPYVSALAATLKGIFPKESSKAIKARIFHGAVKKENIKESKFSNNNLINFKKSISESPRILIPMFKGFNKVKVQPQTNKFEFKIPLIRMNYTDTIKLDIKSSSDVILDSAKLKIDSEGNILVRGTIKSTMSNHLQDFELYINEDIYKFQKSFYLSFKDLETTKVYEIKGAIPGSLTDFSSLNYQHAPYEFPYYYTTKTQGDNLILSLFTRKGNDILPLGTTQFTNTESIVSIHRVDANLDGKADIIVRRKNVVKDKEGNEEVFIVYSYLSEKLRPLFFKREMIDGRNRIKSFSDFKVKHEGTILTDLNNFSWGIQEYSDYGKILVPVYLMYAAQPSADHNPNPFANIRRRIFSEKIFYYSPKFDEEQPEFISRTFNRYKFVDKFKKQIGHKAFEQIFLVKFLEQSFEDIKSGKIRLVVSKESERKLPANFILEITDLNKLKWSVNEIEGEALVLSDFIVEKAFDLSQKTLLKNDIQQTLVGFDKSSKFIWNEFVLNKNQFSEKISVRQSNLFDPLEYPIKTYFSDEKTYRFYLTPSRIQLQIKDNKTNVLEKRSYPVHVSSFLPGMLFKEQHYPISFIDKSIAKPALYVDSTQISKRSIYLITELDNKLVAPIQFNIDIPQNCKALNPHVIDKYKYEYIIQCFTDDGKSQLNFIPLEVK